MKVVLCQPCMETFDRLRADENVNPMEPDLSLFCPSCRPRVRAIAIRIRSEVMAVPVEQAAEAWRLEQAGELQAIHKAWKEGKGIAKARLLNEQPTEETMRWLDELEKGGKGE